MGNMGRGHAEYLLDNKVKNAQLVALCDIEPITDEKYKNLKYFDNYKDLIDSGCVDAVIVATPHYSHTYIGEYALSKGIHTIVEKPISVSKADCERLISAHKDKKVIFTAMFNQRTREPYQKLKELVGSLGKLQRLTCICTDWYRTQAYYNSSSWRASWVGEGGGTLLNQCPHQLDMIIWLCGMPKTVYANLTFGKFHNIDVEDEVNAIFTYENGAIGSFIASTGEYPGTNLLEIEGEMGKLSFSDGVIKIWKNDQSCIEYSQKTVEASKEKKAKTSANYFTVPKVHYEEIKFEEDVYFLNQHCAITQNFVNAILFDEPLISPAEDGIKSVELANAMIMSHIKGEKITVPIDSFEYEKILNSLKEKEVKK